MGKPKKRTSARRTGTRRSHLILKLARLVNGRSPVKVRTTKRESGAKKAVEKITVKTIKTKTTKTTKPMTKAA